MLDNLIVSLGAVVPLFVLVGIGLVVKQMAFLTSEELRRVNKMVFEIFFFFMMFYNIYITDIGNLFRPGLVTFAIASVLLTILIATFIVVRIEPTNARRGTMIQAIFRSNFVLVGIPVVSNLFPAEEIAVTTMMIAVIVPLYNVCGVLVLETFRGGKINPWHMMKSVLQNPMILGAVLGAFLRLAALHIPLQILKPIGQVAAATTPVALIILGASFQLGTTEAHRPQLIETILARLVLVPCAVLGSAYALGFSGIELATLMVIFAAPCAVASFAMAQQMGGDADLAGNAVVFTSGLSAVTLFLWVLLFKTIGAF
ncbi:AEC family transporter [Selenomonas sp. TAMA-11512]|uniref:AEC family transporter n=1 Tax=Selenomonas sp. TAMA-11512 TaxID=3095337 RepID=UPI0030847F5F|nr:AEC family transporter [Selenomonas sp. TAMA-11512]